MRIKLVFWITFSLNNHYPKQYVFSTIPNVHISSKRMKALKANYIWCFLYNSSSIFEEFHTAQFFCWCSHGWMVSAPKGICYIKWSSTNYFEKRAPVKFWCSAVYAMLIKSSMDSLFSCYNCYKINIVCLII